MRKKILQYIIKETRNKKLVSTLLEPTLEECNYLYKHKISVVKSRTKFIYEPTNYIELIDTFEFCREC